MTRIIAGSARGRRLAVPDGRSTRPTSDRTREGLFSALDAALNGFGGLRVLDLYAGSGAVGLEALSRGAAAALLVDSDRAAVRVMHANLDTLGLPGARIAIERVEHLAATPCPDEPYDLVYLDPPYAMPAEDLAAVLVSLADNGWIAPGAMVAVERASRGPEWRWPAGFGALRSRAYGEGTVWYGRRQAGATSESDAAS
ncbi:MAG TPA: 16S rRNA (guanine(966)-N(2))-methyltransferase RsmD [Actinocrinis sp.]|jgi:16S rRNA (guanine966-N2)-methyltransferase|uniref:16S rRNA (guanine(966)-N(2))-methyltransferase RsmD n=1 Tax=Actinocrinis sp. TaxID=1920516 RepID=UPI002D280457|nr:16S rRNA (guanine(966)-N(2))-methyltransferase RsmD [Actinocrinis sp.]HZU57305.1 16S rRNA (guanine(966)-N(2))-methyltransferase RsmD [Actinocrinis sp.]